MSFGTALKQLAKTRGWALELAVAALALLLGIALMPVLIFYAGAATLGRYEGASLGQIYSSLFAGLAQGSTAAWVVFLGPYGLYVLSRVLRFWWQVSGKFS
jgi:hypothetical protein